MANETVLHGKDKLKGYSIGIRIQKGSSSMGINFVNGKTDGYRNGSDMGISDEQLDEAMDAVINKLGGGSATK